VIPASVLILLGRVSTMLAITQMKRAAGVAALAGVTALGVGLLGAGAVAQQRSEGVQPNRPPAVPRPPTGLAAEAGQLLGDAVTRFNSRAAADPVGKGEPPLTEEEVIAAIRGWIPAYTPPVDPEMLKRFERIAADGKLPPGADFSFTTRWTGYNGYYFDVWWVDLTLRSPAGEVVGGYTYRIRDRKIRSGPMTEQEKERREREIRRRQEPRGVKKEAAHE
jgi:hypothetical protein